MAPIADFIVLDASACTPDSVVWSDFHHSKEENDSMAKAIKEVAADVAFQTACRKANCRPTRRQWNKWIKGVGIARRVLKGEAEPLTRQHPAYSG